MAPPGIETHLKLGVYGRPQKFIQNRRLQDPKEYSSKGIIIADRFY
jgi:hypothetical protein